MFLNINKPKLKLYSLRGFMEILINNTPNFQYNHLLKKLYRSGELPIKYGFYGGKLTQKNVSLEHLRPFSKGGKTSLDNLVLATKENNSARSNLPLKDFINIEAAKSYLAQFSGLVKNGFNGDSYINKIKKTLKKMGFEI